MNLNGTVKNGTMGKLLACREQIAIVLKRGYSSEAAGWLLNPVDPEQQAAALISLIVPMTGWAKRLDQDTRETWLMWALRNRGDDIKGWLGYDDQWSLMPKPCMECKDLVRLAHKNGLPQLYLLPAEPRGNPEPTTIQVNEFRLIGVQLATVTYAYLKDNWYKVFPAKLPAEGALNRAIRLYVLGALVGRVIHSANDLYCYELMGLQSWLFYGEEVNEYGMVPSAAKALEHLVIEPEIVGQMPAVAP